VHPFFNGLLGQTTGHPHGWRRDVLSHGAIETVKLGVIDGGSGRLG
jgi:hypothetical protein